MAVAFFIVGHSDDWFLFMGKAALDAIGDGNNGNTIGFVYVTAANFIDGSATLVGPDIERRYLRGLRARETATIATAMSIFDKNAVFTQNFPQTPVAGVNSDVRTVNGHDIAHYTVRNTFHYCLRLADGNVDGSGSAWTGNQSLLRLMNNGVPLTAQGDVPSRYQTWNDLTDTLRAIFDLETANEQHCWLNYLDPTDANQGFPDGHSDHYHVGLAVEGATPDPSKYGHARFRGYTTDGHPEDQLDPASAAANLGLLTVWDDLQVKLSGGIYKQLRGTGAYNIWVQRQEILSANF